jgi:hypothetical protein
MKETLDFICRETEVILSEIDTIGFKIVGRRQDIGLCLTLAVMYKGVEFLVINAGIITNSESDTDIVGEILYKEAMLYQKAIVVIAAYGLVGLVRDFAQQNKSLVFQVDLDGEEEDRIGEQPNTDPDDLPMN